LFGLLCAWREVLILHQQEDVVMDGECRFLVRNLLVGI
jgi:hypothetical protein